MIELFLVNSAIFCGGILVIWLLTPFVMTPLWEKALFFCFFMFFFKYGFTYFRQGFSQDKPPLGFWISALGWWAIALFFLLDLWLVYPSETRFLRLYSFQNTQVYLFTQSDQTGVMLRVRSGFLPIYRTILESKTLNPYEVELQIQNDTLMLKWPEGKKEIAL